MSRLQRREAKHEHLLEVAAREFAALGFADASINRILVTAGVSKGSAYYYFADKADLFFAVVQYCNHQLRLIDTEIDPQTLDAATFWPTFADLHRQPLLRAYARPWLFGALKAAGQLPHETLAAGPLAEFATRLMAFVLSFIQRGQALHLIRDDLPTPLLFAWLRHIDQASDDWLLAEWAHLTRDDIARTSDATVDAMRRAIVRDLLELPYGTPHVREKRSSRAS
jgi:AcrR family transcriptional regulator